MLDLHNPFEKPIPPLDQTDPEANAQLVGAMLGKKWEAKQRALNADRVGTPRPKHKSQADLLAEAATTNAAANAAREKAQSELERATTEASLRADMASYQAKGLNEWAKEVETLITRWNELPQEERNYLINKRKEGYLIIGMPSSQTQLATIRIAIKKLIPTYTNPDTKNREPANPTKIWWDHIQKLITKKDQSLITNTPNHPYFLVVEPTEGPPEDSLNKTLDQQIEFITEQQALDPHLSSINLLGYLVFQVRNTENGQEPVDQRTYTRFVEIQNGGNVVYGLWNPDADDRQLWFNRNGGGASARGGVRVVGMI